MDPPKLLFGIVLQTGISLSKEEEGGITKIMNEKERKKWQGEEGRDIQVLDCLKIAQVLRKLSRDSVVVQDTVV